MIQFLSQLWIYLTYLLYPESISVMIGPDSEAMLTCEKYINLYKKFWSPLENYLTIFVLLSFFKDSRLPFMSTKIEVHSNSNIRDGQTFRL